MDGSDRDVDRLDFLDQGLSVVGGGSLEVEGTGRSCGELKLWVCGAHLLNYYKLFVMDSNKSLQLKN